MKLEAGKQYSVILTLNIMKDIEAKDLDSRIDFDLCDSGFAEVANIGVYSEIKEFKSKVILTLSDKSEEKYGDIFRNIIDSVTDKYNKEFGSIITKISDGETDGVYCGYGDDEGIWKCCVSTDGTKDTVIDNLQFGLAMIVYKLRYGQTDDVVKQMSNPKSKFMNIYGWMKQQRGE